MTETYPFSKISVGISSCLLGQEVRYDGGHKHNTLVTGLLGDFFDWVPVCPEVEMGLGIPREPLRLVGEPENSRMVTSQSNVDHTKSMLRFSRQRLKELAASGLRGYIFKQDSPSCGMFLVCVFGRTGMPNRAGRGLFANALAKQFPMLPLEEEGRLNDMSIRENFVERVFACHRWMSFLEAKLKPKDLVAFHARHELTLLSHSRPHYQELGRLVASAGTTRLRDLLRNYGERFMVALSRKATRRKHTEVLFHLTEYLKKHLDRDDKAELITCIEDYRRAILPLMVPITILKHHFRRYPNDWVSGQTYLNPYPAELMLRNHV